MNAIGATENGALRVRQRASDRRTAHVSADKRGRGTSHGTRHRLMARSSVKSGKGAENRVLPRRWARQNMAKTEVRSDIRHALLSARYGKRETEAASAHHAARQRLKQRR